VGDAQIFGAPDFLSSQLLGFPADARVLIINCDDLGIHDAVNAGVMEAVRNGVASSTSLMVPPPAATRAIELLAQAPAVPFGIHLTLTRDGVGERWAPVTPAERVPSLVDDDGLLLTSAAAPQLVAQARIEEIECELRAQIEVVVRTGLRPTHLDWHALADGGRRDVLQLTITLALEHGLAARVWLEPGRRAARARGLPVVDHDFLDSFALSTAGKTDRFVDLLRALPAGLSEWAVHPAAGDRHTTDDHDIGWPVRRSDHAFLVSQVARDVVAEEGITVIDYRLLQDVWTRDRGD
jgi:predicted glycoside hydrolase/deacetylase ChbG (UPF0249 family)